MYRDKYRPKKPAVYNLARLTENPTRLKSNEAHVGIAEANSVEQFEENRENESESSAEEFSLTDEELEDTENSLNVSNENRGQSTAEDFNLTVDENIEHESTVFVEIQGEKHNDDIGSGTAQNAINENTNTLVHEFEIPCENRNDIDEKDPLKTVELDETEAAGFDQLFDDTSHENTSEVQQLTLGEETVICSPGGTKRATKIIDDDCEFTFELGIGEMFKPVNMGYQVKLNDALSANIPFKENVSAFFNFFKI